MNKQQYLEQDHVGDFVQWAAEFFHTWPKSHTLSGKAGSGHFHVRGIEEAYRQYQWIARWTHPDTGKDVQPRDARTTEESLICLADGLARFVMTNLHYDWCRQILRWGGFCNKGNIDLYLSISGQFHLKNHGKGNYEGFFVPETADDEIVKYKLMGMSSGIASVHSLASISPIAPPDSAGLIMYNSRVAAALTDLTHRFCLDNGMKHIPEALVFACPPAKTELRRIPNRLENYQHPQLKPHQYTRWQIDMLHGSWLLDAILSHPAAASLFPGLEQKYRMLRAQMGLFMLGYNLDDDLPRGHSGEIRENTRSSTFHETPGSHLTGTRGKRNMQLAGGDLRQGDCLELMKDIPEQSIDMILCDLPYGTTRNKWDSVIPLHKLWHEYQRIIKPRGVIALTSQGIFTAKLVLSNEAWFRYKFVWIKSKPTNFLNARRQPLRQHEDVCIFYGKHPHYRPLMWMSDPYDKGTRKAQYTGSYNDFSPSHVKSDGERFPTDALYCKTAESEVGGRVWHPTQKPVALGRYLVRMFTGPDDIVLDNAFGSGSFLVAAAMERRRYIGIEKNEEVHLFKQDRIDYMEVARQRLEEVEQMNDLNKPHPTLFPSLQPKSQNKQKRNRGIMDIDTIVAHA